jgi:hypothetical protein
MNKLIIAACVGMLCASSAYAQDPAKHGADPCQFWQGYARYDAGVVAQQQAILQQCAEGTDCASFAYIRMWNAQASLKVHRQKAAEACRTSVQPQESIEVERRAISLSCTEQRGGPTSGGNGYESAARLPGDFPPQRRAGTRAATGRRLPSRSAGQCLYSREQRFPSP